MVDQKKKVLKNGKEDYYWGMGNTAEAVANQFKVSREDQDEFAYNSHMKALEALKNDKFKDPRIKGVDKKEKTCRML